MTDYTKSLIYGLTITLDIVLIRVLRSNDLNLFDHAFVIFIITSHILFYYALHRNCKPLIDLLHYLIYTSLVVGVFLKNQSLIIMCLALLVTLQLLWKFFGGCILNRVSYIEHGHSQLLEIVVFALTVIYATKLLV